MATGTFLPNLLAGLETAENKRRFDKQEARAETAQLLDERFRRDQLSLTQRQFDEAVRNTKTAQEHADKEWEFKIKSGVTTGALRPAKEGDDPSNTLKLGEETFAFTTPSERALNEFNQKQEFIKKENERILKSPELVRLAKIFPGLPDIVATTASLPPAVAQGMIQGFMSKSDYPPTLQAGLMQVMFDPSLEEPERKAKSKQIFDTMMKLELANRTNSPNTWIKDATATIIGEITNYTNQAPDASSDTKGLTDVANFYINRYYPNLDPATKARILGEVSIRFAQSAPNPRAESSSDRLMSEVLSGKELGSTEKTGGPFQGFSPEKAAAADARRNSAGTVPGVEGGPTGQEILDSRIKANPRLGAAFNAISPQKKIEFEQRLETGTITIEQIEEFLGASDVDNAINNPSDPNTPVSPNLFDSLIQSTTPTRQQLKDRARDARRR